MNKKQRKPNMSQADEEFAVTKPERSQPVAAKEDGVPPQSAPFESSLDLLMRIQEEEEKCRAAEAAAPGAPRKSSSPLWLTVSLGITCALLFVALGISVWELSASQEAYSALEAEYAEQSQVSDSYKALAVKHAARISELRQTIFDQGDELDFWESHVVLTTSEGERYHTYGCPHLVDREFQVLGPNIARMLGYTPCLDCNPPSSGSYDVQSRLDALMKSDD